MKIDINKSIAHKKFHYNKSFYDNVNDILPTIFFLILGLFMLVQLVLNVREGFKTLGLIIAFIFLAILLLALTIKEYLNLDRLEEISTGKNREENKRLTLRLASKLNWYLLEEHKDYSIFRNPRGILNGGEHIVLLYADKLIYFTSTSHPINGVTRTTLTFGANRRNKKKFEKNLNEESL